MAAPNWAGLYQVGGIGATPRRRRARVCTFARLTHRGIFPEADPCLTGGKG